MNTKKYFFIIPGLLLLIFLSACSSKQNSVSDDGVKKIKVAVTIFPLYDLVKTVSGDKIDVRLVLEPGVSPHTYEATPGKIKEMNGAKAFFTIGAGVDAWAENIAKSLTDAKIISMNNYVTLKPFQPEEHEHESDEAVLKHDEDYEVGEEHKHGEFDPHYWLDPTIVESILPHIASELGGLDPKNKDYYQQMASNYVMEIKAKEAVWQDKIGDLKSKEIVVFHDAWGYFANHFGLTVVASFEPFPGKIPSPSYLADLQKKVKEHNIKTLFVEPQFSAEALQTLADDLDVKVGVLDPLGGVPGRDTYINLIDYNVNTIYQANML